MGWPQITYLMLTAAGLGITLVKHGERRTDRHNFVASAIGASLVLFLLNAGGFFA